MSGFLVDTNVLVYAYDQTDGTKRDRARTVLERLGGHQGGVLTTQVLGEFFRVVTQKIPSPLTPMEAGRSVTNYVRSWPVYPVTVAMVLEAVRNVQRHQLAYWDALILAGAKLHNIPYVLTEDFSHGALLEGVRFLNPFAAAFDLALLERRR